MDNTVKPIKDEYKVSKNAYLLEAMFEYFISLLSTGAYLAKLTTAIGVSDGMTAILSSIASLAGMFQIISIFIAHHTPVKRWVVPITFVMQVLISMLYIIPFLNLGRLAPTIFFLIILVSKAAINILSPAKSNWFLSLVDDRERGNFQAKLTIVSLAGSMVFTFAASFIIDKFEENNNIKGAFIILTITICFLAIFQLLCLLVSKEKPVESKEKESPFKDTKDILKNKAFLSLVIFNTLWSVANNITTPFLGTYQIKELGFSMTFITTIGIILSFLQIFVVYFFGRYSMRHSYSSIMRTSYIFAIIAFCFVAIKIQVI